jgi:hypothetical protein
MVSPAQVVNGSASAASRVASEASGVKEIKLNYNSKNEVSVDPDTVNVNDTICFTTPKGKVRVVFVTPFNDNTVEMLDSEERTLTVGGAYPFLCFFTEPGEGESEARTGGVLDVQPHRP